MKRNYFYILAFLFILFNTGFAQVPILNPINGPAVICWDPTVNISYSTSASNSPTAYYWSISPLTNVQLSSYNDTISVVFPNINGTYTLFCVAMNGSGSGNSVSFVITVFEKPNVTFSGNTLFCKGDAINLSASPTGIQASSTLNSGSSTLSYTWAPGTGLNTTVGPNVIANPTVTSTYTVSVFNGPCTSTSALTLTVDLCLGITQQVKPLDNIVVYPNPSSGMLTINFNGWSGEDGTLQIIGSTGEMILTDKIKAPLLVYDLARLQRGMYFMVFKDKTGTRTVKLIME